MEGWQHLSGVHTWVEISQRLKYEAAHWNEHGTTGDTSSVRTTAAAWRVCDKPGFNFQCATLLVAIYLYTTRNQPMHRKIGKLAAVGDWGSMARRLHDDLGELPRVLPIVYMEAGLGSNLRMTD